MRFNPEKDKIAVLGQGYVGIPLSLLLAQRYKVIGFDTDKEKIMKLKMGRSPIKEPGVQELLESKKIRGNIEYSSEPSSLKLARIKIITVGTPYDNSKDFIDYTQLESALDLLKNNLSKGDIVILKSTVPPGTTRNYVISKIASFGFKVPEDVGVAYSPERMVEGQAISDFKTLPKIIGSTDDETASIVSEVIGSLGGDVIKVSSVETAEMVKMVDNYSRYVFLALTNEIALISEKVGVDVLEVLSAAKHNYPRNAGLLLPGPGVGGSCLNKDPFILRAHMARNGLKLKMVEAAHEVNGSMPAHVASIVKQFAGDRRNVLIAGVAFKGDTDDTRFSPAFTIMSLLKSSGFNVSLTDPFVLLEDLNISNDLIAAAKGKDIILLLTDHSEYRKIDLAKLKAAMNPNPLIIDTRGLISKKDAVNMGFEYHGLGRL